MWSVSQAVLASDARHLVGNDKECVHASSTSITGTDSASASLRVQSKNGVSTPW